MYITHIYNSTLYLPTFSESNAWDFCLVMTGISENVPATSEDFQQFYEDCWTLLKMFKNVPMNFEHFWSYLKVNNFSVFNFVRSQSHHSMPFWKIFRGSELNFHYYLGKKSAHEPKAQMARAYSGFLSMKHAKENCYSLLDGMLVHGRVIPQKYVAGTHLYTWVKRDKVEQSSLSKETMQRERFEAWISRSRVRGVNHLATQSSKNNSYGFVSQAWEIEIVLDVWHQCIQSAGMRLKHNMWDLAGTVYIIPKKTSLFFLFSSNKIACCPG